MSGVAGAIVGSAVIGAAGSAYAGSQQSKAAKNAQRQNKAAMDEKNRLDYERFLESRGAYGSAILPLYFREGAYSHQDLRGMSDTQLINLAKESGVVVPGITTDAQGVDSFGPDGNRDMLESRLVDLVSKPFESTTAKEAMSIYNMGKTPEELAAVFGGIQDRFRPAQEGAAEAITGIYTGARESQRLGDFQALADQRTSAARLENEALKLKQQEQLNQFAAQNQRKGYVGTGYGNRLGQLQIGQQIAGKGALATSLANLKNAQEKFQIQDQERDLRLSNVDQANAGMARAMGFETAPQVAQTKAFTDKFSVTNPFRLGVGQAPTTTAFESAPITPTGAYIGKGIADVAGTIGQAYATGAMGGGGGGELWEGRGAAPAGTTAGFDPNGLPVSVAPGP